MTVGEPEFLFFVPFRAISCHFVPFRVAILPRWLIPVKAGMTVWRGLGATGFGAIFGRQAPCCSGSPRGWPFISESGFTGFLDSQDGVFHPADPSIDNPDSNNYPPRGWPSPHEKTLTLAHSQPPADFCASNWKPWVMRRFFWFPLIFAHFRSFSPQRRWRGTGGNQDCTILEGTMVKHRSRRWEGTSVTRPRGALPLR